MKCDYHTLLLSLMLSKIAKVTHARVLLKRKIITYFHLSSELKKNIVKNSEKLEMGICIHAIIM